MRPASVVITGASRGIGAALALHYAGPGVTLCLLGRDPDGLASVSEACRKAGATVLPHRIDVRERDALAACLRDFDAAHPVDLVLANAGIALATNGADDAIQEEIAVNLVGALNTVLPLLSAMAARGRGQVAFMSSIAAFAPLPQAPGYSASKAALLSYGLSLRRAWRGTGVRINVICPGFVETGMGARYRGWRPMVMSPERAVRIIAAGLAEDRALIAFPRILAAAARLTTLLPEPLIRLGLWAFRGSVMTG